MNFESCIEPIEIVLCEIHVWNIFIGWKVMLLLEISTFIISTGQTRMDFLLSFLFMSNIIIIEIE